MGNTRFNPTTNGMLHLGHIYMVLVNQVEAQKNGGKFILRFDDNQRYWRDKMGEQKTKWICASILEDLEWLEIRPDEVIYQSEIEHGVLNQLENVMRDTSVILRGRYYHDEVPFTKKPYAFYPYTPYYTLEKVWMDFQEGVDNLIRGEDLISEFALYEYFVDLLGLPRVRHTYLPRLCAPKGELTDLSKTAGNFKIKALREMGMAPEQVMLILRNSCLIHTEEFFSIGNIRETPYLDMETLERLVVSSSIRI